MKELSMKDKELMLKDLSARSMYGVKISQGPYCRNPIKLNSISIVSIGTFFNGYFTEGIHFTFNGEGDIWPKACLRSLSSMTEEEKIELYKIAGFYYFSNNELLKDEWRQFSNALSKNKLFLPYPIWGDDLQKVFDFLNAHHFDYRGLIEKGLAIEAPEGIYK